MNLSVFALRNYQVSIVALLLLVVLGSLSLQHMPRSEDPQFNFPASIITVLYPGTNPNDMEKLIVDPIEQALNELEDIQAMKTTIEDGLMVIRIEFLFGSDPEDKYDDVVAAIARIRDQLPTGIARLSVDKISPSEVNVLQLALQSKNGQLDYRKAQYWSDRLEKHLQRLPGVMRVDAVGFPPQQLTVRANLPRMRSLNISLNQLINAVQGAGANVPAGHVNAGERRFTVRTSGDFESIEQLKRTLITTGNGQSIKVQDIAEVKIDDAMPNYLTYFQGEPAVFITLVQRKGSNIFTVVDGVKAAVADFETLLDPELTINWVHDQSVSVNERVNGFFSSLLQGLVIVGLLSLALLGMRAALVVVLAIPMSVAIGLGWLDFSGFGLQQMSIAGLVIALGLLVDNAIVVTENVGRFVHKGYNSQQAAEQGASQVALAVASGTLTTILAFLPILLLPTGSGTFMRSMPVTVILVLMASLLVAIAFTPLLAGRLLKANSSKHVPLRKPIMQRALEELARGAYQRTLRSALNRPWAVCVLAVLVFVGSLSLFPHIGVSLFPKAEKPAMLINIELPEGASFARTQALTHEVAQAVQQKESVVSVAANVGKGNPRIYYNEFPRRQVPNYAQLYVQLTHFTRTSFDQLVAELRDEFAQIAGANITVKEFYQGPPNEAPIEIRILGDNIQRLREVAMDVEQMVRATQGTVNIDNPIGKNKIDIQVAINREKAALAAVPISNIDQSIRASLSGYTAGTYRDDLGEDFAIVVRKQGAHEPQVEELQSIFVQSVSGALIPLSQLADIHLVTDIPRFQHHNMQRMVHVTADLASGFQAEPITNSLIEQLQEYSFPSGVTFSIGGEQETRKESFAGMSQAFLFALLGIFAVLVMQFRSFRQPLIIFAAIPFAISGAFIGLYLTGYTFSFTAFVGLTSLIGIVVNNSIILVDFANQKVALGDSPKDAMLDAAATRLPPIILTTLTTVGGLLPLTLTGSGMWSPMGWSIISGLLLSTLLTLFVIPVLYQWLSGYAKNVKETMPD